MRAGVLGKSYARVWAKLRAGAVLRWVCWGLQGGPGRLGAVAELGELVSLAAGVVVVGEMSTRHSRAPEGSRTPWRMALPSLSRMRR